MKRLGSPHFSAVLTLIFSAAACLTTSLRAEPLKSATVTQIGGEKRDVAIAKEGAQERAAVVNDAVVGKDVLRTGQKSRAELTFQDKSFARLGSNTIFSFDPNSADRKMKLERGTALIHVPPGLDGARISSPAATAAIRGDVVAMRVNPEGKTQIVRLSKDQEVIVTFNKTGETKKLQVGEMLTIDPMAIKLPEPVAINVEVFVQSSQIVNGQGLEKKELPASAEKEVKVAQDEQAKEIKNGNLEDPNRVKTDATGADKAAQQGTEVASALVQATQGGRFAGHFVGMARDNPPGSNISSMTIDVDANGTFVSTMVNQSGGTDITRGNWSTGGTFTGSNSDGNSVSGNFAQTGTSLHGTYVTPNPSFGTVTGTYNTNKQ